MAGIADLDLPESDEDLLALVFRDDLTGLLNRRFFARFMKQVADWSDGAPPVALAMMDMDNLKRINDRLGHMSGDATLKRLGELFREELKEGQYAVRYAGDEFALILPGSTRKEALELANRLRQAVVKDGYKDAKLPEGLRPSLSIGVACFPADAPAGGDELTEAADRALYYSKRTGKNRVTSAADIVDAEEVSDLEALSGFPSRTLVGRKAAFEVADEAISLVLDDHFGFVLVQGEAGTGKTRLLGEFARYAQERDLAVLIERCTPVSRDDPYRVLANLLERYLKANPAIRDRCLSELSPAQRSALREVLPNLPPDRRRPPTGATPPTASRR
ncbi:MAG: diguanylate cyclase, partial [Planctomycetes bacterium]|nr:diguanylate cyclase [Planctomycetota bacterium]